jgi:hypothetical protein
MLSMPSSNRRPPGRPRAGDRFHRFGPCGARHRNGDDAVLRRGVRTAVASARPGLPDLVSMKEGRLSSMKGRVMSRGGWPFLTFGCEAGVVIIGIARS